MTLFDLRVTVDRIEGRSVCGLRPGDYFEVTESNRIQIPDGRHFCLYAVTPSSTWLARRSTNASSSGSPLSRSR